MLRVVPPPPAEPSPLQEGALVGPYVLEALIGEGTMGRVYRAKHQRLGRQVALKVLHAHRLEDKLLVAASMRARARGAWAR